MTRGGEMRRLTIAAIAGMIMVMGLVGGGHTGGSTRPDVLYDVGSLEEDICWNYTADLTGYRLGYDTWIETFGEQTYYDIHNSCFTPCANAEDPIECYEGGDLWFSFRAAETKDNYSFQISGMRRAAAVVYAATGGVPPMWISWAGYLSGADDAIHQTGPYIQEDDGIYGAVMWCPDVNQDGTIDLFNDIMETSADFACNAPWTAPGCASGPATDHNEDDTIDLFNDIFTVAERYSLDCDAWLTQFE